MPDLLLELRSEEIPARMQRKAAGDLKKLVTDALVDAGLTYEGAQEYWTPRRLTLDIRGLSARSSDMTEERKGPRTDAPEKAIEGFLRGAGLASTDEAEIRNDPKKGAFYVAVLRKSGRDAEEIISEALPAIIRNFPWPKSMRWGKASAKPGALRWVRPLQSILCTYGPETEETRIINFDVDGITAGNITYGHRFHAPEPITVRRFDDYVTSLEKAQVVLDAERRKNLILEEARNLAFANGLELVEDPGLAEEVSGLVEWPTVLMGEFENEFLAIPDEVIRLTIKTNQKCFVTRKDGLLSNRFILVSNIEARDGGAEIAYGNGKVVRARLSDALYFWNTDQSDLPDLDKLKDSAEAFSLNLAKPLDQRMARLDQLGVTFHARLGTQGERVMRIARLAKELAPVVGANPEKAVRASVLSKADLQTEIVQEFPEVQGVMGRTYALMQDEDEAVAAAIEEHYKPQGPADVVPHNPVSIAVALADKLDTLIGFWVIDEKPTGSKDPYALRRAALGVIRIIAENDVHLPLLTVWRGAWLRAYASTVGIRIANTLSLLGNLAEDAGFALALEAFDTYRDKLDGEASKEAERLIKAESDLLSFLHDRLEVYLKDAGARHDLIDAVITPCSDDLLMIIRRVEALNTFLQTDDGTNLLAGTKRAANILAAEEKKGAEIISSIDSELFESDEERALYDTLEEAEHFTAQAIANENFEQALSILARLRHPVDAFFDAVMVNADDEKLRNNRLALLARIRSATDQVADFSKISG